MFKRFQNRWYGKDIQVTIIKHDYSFWFGYILEITVVNLPNNSRRFVWGHLGKTGYENEVVTVNTKDLRKFSGF